MSATGASGPVRTRTPRWVWVVLVISLALNFLVIGAGARALLRAPFFMERSGSYMRYAEQLPPERRERVQAAASAVRAEIGESRQELRRARREAAEIFSADPFNKERFVAAQRRIMDAELKFH